MATFNPSFTLTDPSTISLYLAALVPLPNEQIDRAAIVTNLRTFNNQVNNQC